MVLNATAKVANKVLDKVTAGKDAKAQTVPAQAPSLFESKAMGFTLLQGLYRPPNATLGRAALRLGSPIILGVSTGFRPEDGHTTTMTEFDFEVVVVGSQKSGGRLGLTTCRLWSWGSQSLSNPQTGSDLGLGAVVGYRHVLPTKLVFDIILAAGFVSNEIQDNNGPRSSTGFNLINGGVGLGWSPF